MADVPPKKDLTSLVDLSAMELAETPGGGASDLEEQELEKVSESDFGDLEDMARQAAAAVEEQGAQDDFVALDTPPGESPPLANTPSFLDEQANFEGPAISFMEGDAAVSPLEEQQSQSARPFPEEAIDLPALSEQPSAGGENAILPDEQGEFVAEPSSVADAASSFTDDQQAAAHAPISAPPVGAQQAKKSSTAPGANQDLSDVKKFADKFAIGRPKIEGAPAFSILIRSATGKFDEKTVKAIEGALTSENFGIRLEDVAVQLSSGKLLVPQISEFAAVTLAQKLRDAVDSIELDLAAEIFKSTAAEVVSADDSILMDTEEFQMHREEVRDLGAEPRNEEDLFSSNLPELSEYQVTRILSAVLASQIIFAEVAEDPSSKDFEIATERLTRELVTRAFKLGAHGVLGVNFTLKSIEAHKDPTGQVRKAYRLLGSGTAVRVRKR